jgi:hypothetical protein
MRRSRREARRAARTARARREEARAAASGSVVPDDQASSTYWFGALVESYFANPKTAPWVTFFRSPSG